MRIFGLSSYDVVFLHDLLDDAYSQISIDQESGSATVIFTTMFENICTGETKEELICTTALHEVLHLLLGDIDAQAGRREFDQLSFTCACHALINRLVPVLEEKIKN